MHEYAHVDGGMSSSDMKDGRPTVARTCEGLHLGFLSFSELLSSRLASLEQELIAAHLKALASERTEPILPGAPQDDPDDAAPDPQMKCQQPTEAWVEECLPSSAAPDGVFIKHEDPRASAPKNGAVVKFTDIMPEPVSQEESDTPTDTPTPTTSVQSLEYLKQQQMAASVTLTPSEGIRNIARGYRGSELVRLEKAAYVVRSGQFELLATWRDTKGRDRKKKLISRAASLYRHSMQSDSDGGGNDDRIIESMAEGERFVLDHPHTIEAEWFLKNRLLLPNSMKRASWDILSLILVAYDVIVLPLGFFDLPDSALFVVMTWLTRIFWTLDIPMSLLTGYLRRDGTIEMRPRKIWQKYMYTWFPLDVIIVLTDWFELISSGFGFARVTKASRTFRIIRMIRLLRVAKVQQVLGLLIERVQSEMVHTVAEMGEIILVLLVVAHLIACIWWGIGCRDETDTWVEEVGARRLAFSEQYALSLHWSISQFTGGMDEIQAENVNERYFVIGVFLFCFILASLFLSSLTSSITQLQFITNKQSRQVQKLRRFLHQSGISGRTALRIQMNAQHAVAERMRLMPEDDVELLKMVSEPLRYELHFEMYSEIFDSHIFFGRYKEECPAVVRKMCHSASSVSLVSRGDLIFSVGELPEDPKAYVFFEGFMSYISSQGSTFDLHLEQWIAEAALWTTWRHQGVLTALADCRLYTLDARKFQAIVLQFEHNAFDPRRYAHAYIEDLNKLGAEELTDLSFHLVAPGAEKSALKHNTEVYDLCKDEYNMRITRGALVGETPSFL